MVVKTKAAIDSKLNESPASWSQSSTPLGYFSEFYSKLTSLICYLIVKRTCMYSTVCNRKSVYFIKLQYNFNLIDFAGFAVKRRNSNSGDEGATTGVRLCKTTRWVDINPRGWAKGQITLTDLTLLTG